MSDDRAMGPAEHLEPGELIRAGSKLYSVCKYCETFVRVNKPILGGWHVCLHEDDRDAIDRSRRARRG